MEHKNEKVYLARFIAKGIRVQVSWDSKVALNKYVTKGKPLGKVLFEGSSLTVEVKSHISGQIASLLSEPFVAEEDVPHGKLELLEVIPCQHPLAFEGVCTYCNEAGIKSHTRKIFDQISSISASDDMVEEKLNEVLKGGKYILILDLDNTIIHARDVPSDYNLFEHFPEEDPSEYFETCYSEVNKTKYIIRKRPLLNQFLQQMSKHFAIFVYTFGTRRYGLDVIHNIDPKELYLKKTRLISKQDFDLEHKELEKIIPEKFKDLVLILDDNAHVWHKYRENLLQVLPYFFWHHEELKDAVTFTSHKDYYLHAVYSLIERAVTLHKKSGNLELGRKIKLQKFIYDLQAKMFLEKVIIFSGLAEKSEDVLSKPEAKLVRDRGGTVVKEVGQGNLLVNYSFKPTQKVKEARAKGIPIVYMLWFKYSLKYMVPLCTEFFSLAECTAQKTENMAAFEKQIFEYHHEERLKQLSSAIDEYVFNRLTAVQQVPREEKLLELVVPHIEEGI